MLVARLEAARLSDVGVHERRGSHDLPAVTARNTQRVLDQGMFEQRAFIGEEIPSPAGGGSRAGEIDQAEGGADGDVRTGRVWRTSSPLRRRLRIEVDIVD